MEDHNCSVQLARQAVVSGNVFTTHTPVPAGFDLFEPQVIEKYFSNMLQKMGLSLSEFLKMVSMMNRVFILVPVIVC